MRAQEEKIKGFTIFEVIIVMVLIGIVSGLAYPNFSQWRKDRAVKNSAIKIRGLFLNTTAQVQRGLYSFAQVYVNTEPTEPVCVEWNDDGDCTGTEEKDIEGIAFVSRGMKQTSISTQRSEHADIWKESDTRCAMESGGTEGDFWDDDGGVNDKPEVSAFNLEDISLNFIGEAAVCFSKDGSLYGTVGGFINGNEFFGSSVWVMYICDAKNDRCIIDEDGETEGITYALSWSRFGNVTLYRYNSRDEEFVVQ